MSATKPLLEHVRNHLIRTGVLTPDGHGRKARLEQCSRCDALVATGLDSHRCALMVVVDLAALDQLGEAVALLNGRGTFEFWGREIERRDQWRIAGGQSRPVVAEHACTVLTSPSAEILALFVAKSAQPISGEAPF